MGRVSLISKINKVSYTLPNLSPTPTNESFESKTRLSCIFATDLGDRNPLCKSAKKSREVLHNGSIIHLCLMSRGSFRKEEMGSGCRVRGFRGKVCYRNQKCQIPARTPKPTNGWICSKISRVTDGNEKKKNLSFPPNLLSPTKMLEDLDVTSMINLTNFASSFVFGRGMASA
jgi:hypothetical protein